MIPANEKLEILLQSLYHILDGSKKIIGFIGCSIFCLLLLFAGNWRRGCYPRVGEAQGTFYLSHIFSVDMGTVQFVISYWRLFCPNHSLYNFLYLLLVQTYHNTLYFSRRLYASGYQLLSALFKVDCWGIFNSLCIKQLSRICSSSSLLDKIDFRIISLPSGALA